MTTELHIALYRLRITFAEMGEQGVRVVIAPQWFHIFEAQWCRAGDQSMGGHHHD
jgi:hypothetical protein